MVCPSNLVTDCRRMEQAAPGQCDLHGSGWKLVNLSDEPAVASPEQPEPHLTVTVDEQRVPGSGGCSQVTGSFERDGDRLRFSRMVSTMMACPDGMDQEKRLLDGLERVKRYRSRGGRLEQVDGIGTAIARFDAVRLK